MGLRAIPPILVGLAALLLAGGGVGAPTPPQHALISDPAGDNGQSFTTTPTDLRQLELKWDGATFTVAATYQQPPSNYALALLVSSESKPDPNAESCDPTMADQLTVHATKDGTASLTMSFVQGAVTVTGTVDAAKITYSFVNPTLTTAFQRGRDPFNCVSGNADGDTFFGHFDGKQLRLTSAGATAALRAELARRYGTAFTKASRVWVACPAAELISTDEFGEFAACRFNFGNRGGVFRTGQPSMLLISGLFVPDYMKAFSYRKALSVCPIPRTVGGWVNGASISGRRLVAGGLFGNRRHCRQMAGPAGMLSDIDYDASQQAVRALAHLKVGFHGTNLAGFEKQVAFTCKFRASGLNYRFDCANKLGDRFVYSFTLHPGR
jgi:hypothetical protein